MRPIHLLRLAASACLAATVLSGCVALPHDAAAVTGPSHPAADAAYGQAQSGEFQ